jgi:uncharacterized protein (TIGR02145 family)
MKIMNCKLFFTTIAIFFVVFNLFAQKKESINDPRDGKTYLTVEIGTQTWMAQNLAYKADSGCWAYGNYGNTGKNVMTYGYLYDWAMANNACPSGWHLPSYDEWSTLLLFLGDEKTVGTKLKEEGSSHWASPNTGSTNQTGFSAIPGGFRLPPRANSTGLTGFDSLGRNGYWWNSTEKDSTNAWAIGMRSDNTEVEGLNYPSDVYRQYNKKEYGFSVRCIKD